MNSSQDGRGTSEGLDDLLGGITLLGYAQDIAILANDVGPGIHGYQIVDDGRVISSNCPHQRWLSESVQAIDVCSIFDQHLDDAQISGPTGIVQRSLPVARGFVDATS